jgi:carboxylate-amine ligase
LSETRWTIGVEEEFQIVDAATRALRPHGARILSDVQHEVGEAAQHELFLSQIETGTPVCSSLTEVREQVKRLRHAVIEGAQHDGALIAAAGTHPFSLIHDQPIVPKERYVGMAELYQQLAREHFICGCHVHVGINDRELSIQILNRARGWLSPLVALAANSPFWEGEDTGYASFRTEVWRRWPMAGSAHPFGNRAEYEALARTLVETGAIIDETRIYWDIRPADRFETLEFRATDVCLSVDEAVMTAGLCRSMVRKLAADVEADAQRGAVYVPVRPEVLRAAEWRAARYGLEETLIDVHAGKAVPAAQLIETLLEFLREDLEAQGEWDEISTLVRAVLSRGNGAQRQRAAYAKRENFADVVDLIVEETARGVM